MSLQSKKSMMKIKEKKDNVFFTPQSPFVLHPQCNLTTNWQLEDSGVLC